MNRAYIAALILLIAVCSAAAAVDPAIRLVPRAEVDADDVRLADLVDPADRERLSGAMADLVVATAPAAGGEVRLTDVQLRSRIEHANAPVDALTIPESIRVRRASQTIGEDQIKAAVRAYVARHLPWPDREHEVEFTGPIVAVTAAPGPVAINVRPNRRGDLIDSVSFDVEVRVGGAPVKRLWVTTKIHVYATAWKAAKAMRRHHAFGEIDLLPERVDLASASSGVVVDRAELIGKRTKMSVAAGTVVTRRMVELPPLMKKGDVVTILVSSGPMTLTALGEVVKDAGDGDRVRVKNLETKKVVYGRVLNQDTVVVEF